MRRLRPKKHAPRARVRLLVLGLALASGLAGCSWTDQSGTHHLVVGIGFGVITSYTNCPGVQVSESRILGAEIGPNFSGVGLLQHHRVEIAPALTNNVVVSINSRHGNLTVTNFNPCELYTNIFIQTVNCATNQ